MERYHWIECVETGITYLNKTYPGWFDRIDTLLLDMCDHRMHVLAQVCECLVYETKEVAFWSRAELERHGFVPIAGVDYMPHLTAEWQYQIRQLRERG